MADLWPEFNIENREENRAIPILREQARLLEKKTNQRVKATFSKITYKEPPLVQSMQYVASALSMYSEHCNQEILDDELCSKKDINSLFNPTKYKFEIYNETYRFRVFVLNYSEIFPVTLVLDSGIGEELNNRTEIEIDNNNELENLLSSIFSSKKVVNVISRMMQHQ